MKRTFLTAYDSYLIPSRNNRVLFFDWPGYPASTYLSYRDTLEEVGLGTSLQEMMGWLFSGMDVYGNNQEVISDIVTALYVAIEPRLPKRHDSDYVYELLLELMGVMFNDFSTIYSLIRPNALRIEVGPVTVFGVYLRVTERQSP